MVWGGMDVWCGLPLREDPMLAPVLKLLPPSLDTYTLPKVLTIRKYTVEPVKGTVQEKKRLRTLNLRWCLIE